MCETRIIHEDDLEPVYCEECGEGNVFDGHAHGCLNCTWWVELMTAPERQVPNV